MLASRLERGFTAPGRVVRGSESSNLGGALGGIRTPNLLIRSQMLYPLSYERLWVEWPGEFSVRPAPVRNRWARPQREACETLHKQPRITKP